MMNRILLPCLFFMFLALTSCSDDEQTVTLFSKSWKPSLQDKNLATNPPPVTIYSSQIAVYKNWFTCELDDTYKFNKNGTLVITHKGPACDGETDATTALPYTLDSQTNELIIDGVNYTLCEVSSRQLKYATTISTASGLQNYILVFN